MSPTTGDDDYIIPGCLATIKCCLGWAKKGGTCQHGEGLTAQLTDQRWGVTLGPQDRMKLVYNMLQQMQ
jgi:hypothetical protein